MRNEMRLENYYKSRGILGRALFAKDGEPECKCAHWPDCKALTEMQGLKIQFVGNASVGLRYWTATPRLLFISLDGGGGDTEEPETNYLYRNLPEKFSDYPDNYRDRHWYQTHEFAAEILRAFDPGIDIDNVQKYIAHTNAARCTQNREDRGEADEALFINCRDNLDGELAILAPDIIVTQGDKAHRSIAERYEKLERIAVAAQMPRGTGQYIRIIKLHSEDEGDKKVVWLAAYHPGAGRPRGKYWKAQRKGEAEFIRIIRGWSERQRQINLETLIKKEILQRGEPR